MRFRLLLCAIVAGAAVTVAQNSTIPWSSLGTRVASMAGGDVALVSGAGGTIDASDAAGNVVLRGGFLAHPLARRLVTSEGSAPALPLSFSLGQNFPNPFNPTTVIEYAISHPNHVTLTIYSVLGQEVATLVNGEQAAGTFKTEWDASSSPSGVYFYRLTAGEHVQTRKMVLMK